MTGRHTETDSHRSGAMNIAVIDLEPGASEVGGDTALGVALDAAGAMRDTTVTLIAIGPPRIDPALRTAIGLGANRAIRIWEPSLEPITTTTAAKLAVAAMDRLPVIVLCSPVSESSLLQGTPGAIAAHLDCPYVEQVHGVARTDAGEPWLLRRNADNLVVDGGAVGRVASVIDPGYVSISRIMDDPVPHVEVRRPEELGVSADCCVEIEHHQVDTTSIEATDASAGSAPRLVEMFYSCGMVTE